MLTILHVLYYGWCDKGTQQSSNCHFFQELLISPSFWFPCVYGVIHGKSDTVAPWNFKFLQNFVYFIKNRFNSTINVPFCATHVNELCDYSTDIITNQHSQ